MKFKIGDRVQCITENECCSGLKGTVVDVEYNYYGVKWDGFKRGHNCHGILKDKDSAAGWYVYGKGLKLLKPSKEKIILYVEDNKIHCQYINKDGVKGIHTTALCAPSDDFDLLVGAQIALLRMVRLTESPIVMDKRTTLGSVKLEDIL